MFRKHGNEVRVVSTGKQGDTPYLMDKQYMYVFEHLIDEQGMTFAKPDEEKITRAVAWADVIHFITPFVLSKKAMMIAREMGKPYTAAFHVQPENITSSVHLGNADVINNLLYTAMRDYFYQYTPHIHCPSRFIANELEKHGYKSQLHVISNGIDPDFKYEKKEKPPELKDKFVILTTGRYSVEKRQDVLINAAKRSKYADSIKLILAGQGPRDAYLRGLAESLPVAPTFRFFTKGELLDVIAQSDLYAHCADAEIEAMSCMEAFAGGLVPVIADSPKSATPQFALCPESLFAAGDPDALAERIDYWIEHPTERAEAEKKYAQSAKKYGLEECASLCEEMFRTAIEEAEAQKNGNEIK